MSDFQFMMNKFDPMLPMFSGGYFVRLKHSGESSPFYKVVVYNKEYGWLLIPEDHKITHVIYLEDIENSLGENNG